MDSQLFFGQRHEMFPFALAFLKFNKITTTAAMANNYNGQQQNVALAKHNLSVCRRGADTDEIKCCKEFKIEMPNAEC